MATPTPKKKQTGDTYIMNSGDPSEMIRLLDQEKAFRRAIGEPLEYLSSDPLHDVLDCACGPGGWIRALAKRYSHISATGVDISQRMIDYAQVQAKEQHLSNVRFERLSIIFEPDPMTPSIKQLPSASYDLINARLIMSVLFLPTWPLFLQECLRLLRPGGYVQLTECEDGCIENAPVFASWSDMMREALKRDNRIFAGKSITTMFHVWLHQVGFAATEEHAFSINFSSYAESHQAMRQNIVRGIPDVIPFLKKHFHLSTQQEHDFIEVIPQEMDNPQFHARWYGTTVIGRKPQQ